MVVLHLLSAILPKITASLISGWHHLLKQPTPMSETQSHHAENPPLNPGDSAFPWEH